ncbi:hypothetical protein SmJEL517_g02271 [Synchytrium microbalum]|uniref:AB hydrolase-1 domain-containing protein n=1 Tax=Synchytrium microbalum TaxID=1806994 RepID=A0A507CCJ8_9FUNG|nr:uncharacterized protein SmJEL517_g02271 [Synchytrium microbalum]TPX35263.1 hypothetical protein SmJEL517_g02271 [Synchytrium microbalum]
MDPLKPDETFNHQFAYSSKGHGGQRLRIHYVDQGPKNGDVIVCLHGFPGLWYDFRYQIPALVQKGYRVFSFDLPGYGQSDAPTANDHESLKIYSFKSVGAIVLDIVESVAGAKQVILLQHDWGGALGYRMALHYPDRIKGIMSVCTPYQPPSSEYIPLQVMVDKYLPQFDYQLWYEKPETDAELEANVEFFFRGTMRGKEESPGIMRIPPSGLHNVPRDIKLSKYISRQELDYYVRHYTQRKFHGSLNWYRTRKINFDDELSLPKTLPIPVLMVVAMHDPSLKPAMAEIMKDKKLVPQLTMKQVDSSHWVMWEAKAVLNSILSQWLDDNKAKLADSSKNKL